MIDQRKSTVKFLLVDDLEDNLLVLAALLQREGLETLLARSGKEALELLLVHDVALALVDVQMPEMDGFELAELMRGVERTRHVPIIFVTAGVREHNRVFQGYDAGAVDFLFKPIDERILRHKTETFFQLYKQRQALADTLRFTEELMAVVGHDLRNPLNAIMMTAEVLASDASNEKQLKAAARLRSSGTRMLHIIDELFDLSRARLGGGIPIVRKPTNLLNLTRKIISEFDTKQRPIELRHEGNLEGNWDANRLEQVCSNLVGNALRHGDPSESVVVSLTDDGARVSFAVHNSGRISQEILPRLFEPFQTGQGKRTRTEGLGLGLYIVQQIVVAHGGTVEVASSEAAGTTFVVELPRE